MKTITGDWSAVADAPDPATLYTADQLADMAELLQIRANQRPEFEVAIGHAGAVYLRLGPQETAPQSADVVSRHWRVSSARCARPCSDSTTPTSGRWWR